MTTFELTRNETWVLSSLLSLPIQHGSVLGEWLGSDDIPDVDLWGVQEHFFLSLLDLSR